MARKPFLNTAGIIFLSALALALPNFQTILIDFTQWGDGAILLARLGFIALIGYLASDMIFGGA